LGPEPRIYLTWREQPVGTRFHRQRWPVNASSRQLEPFSKTALGGLDRGARRGTITQFSHGSFSESNSASISSTVGRADFRLAVRARVSFIFGDADGLVHVAQGIFGNDAIAVPAKNQADRRGVGGVPKLGRRQRPGRSSFCPHGRAF